MAALTTKKTRWAKGATFTFRLERDLLAALKRAAAREGVAPGQLARRALREWLERHAAEQPR